jgi:hypothetical protein
MVDQRQINIDATKIPNMKCWCGSEVFIQVFNLKYLSPILVGDPKGGSVNIMQWSCLKCFTYYPAAMPQSEVEKRRPPMDDAEVKPGPGK